ncbi:MAG: septum formation initiator family protein [Nannocystaceae bacterium]
MDWLRRILLAGLLATAIAYCPREAYRSAGADDLSRIEREHVELVRSNDRLKAEIEVLRSEVAALKRDPAEVARIAREDLGLIRPGEVVFEVSRP